MKTTSQWTAVATAIVLAWGITAPAPAAAQGTASVHQGAERLGLELRRLGTTKRVLMIAAHPDDENTALLAELALGQGADVAYLALTRGEGGQNLIGPELEEGLGLIRTEELMAARRLDGARQFFSRAYDFGFSKSADEAFGHWPRDSVLSDVVAVVRKFRPDVIVAVFTGTPADGHGQHQVSGILAREAFRAAADPSRFPDQVARGLAPWQAKYLFQSLWQGSPPGSIRLSTGDLDPLLGESHYQAAMASRSRHRSQDMGTAQPIGPQSVAVNPVSGGFPAGATSMFAGTDTTLSILAADVAGAPASLRSALEDYERLVASARKDYNPFHPESIRPVLGRALADLDRAAGTAASLKGEGAEALRGRLSAEREQAGAAAWDAANLVFDAVADQPRVVPGQDLTVTLRLWNGEDSPVQVAALEPRLPEGWSAEPQDATPTSVASGDVAARRFRVHVPGDAPPTEPYFLRRPRNGDMYRWPAADSIRNLPFAPPAMQATARVKAGDATLVSTDEITYADVDKAVGERRVPILVVPAVSVALTPRVTIVPVSPAETASTRADGGSARTASAQDGAATRAPARELTVELHAAAATKGTLELTAPEGWTVAPARQSLDLAAGEMRTVRATLTPPSSPAPGQLAVDAAFRSDDARTYERGYTVIDYPHISPHALYRPAETLVSVVPVSVPADLRVGYVMGAGDDGPDALRQMGVSVDLLGAEALTSGDLSKYDAIVTGIRAYEVRTDLDAKNGRLMEYVRNGGTLVVQYNKYEFVEGDYAPYPLTMAQPHDRITDEDADVTFLEPDHPALSSPNRLTPEDFHHWIQDKGLYYAHTWDDRYTPLLSMHDPGEEPVEGGLLVAKVGRGWYVYTGLALFRQFPQGVPGAYRLLANLVSLGSAR